jgi:protein TonB
MSNTDFKKASWDDIIFDNLNKDYGAYVLRGLIGKHTLRGFIIAMGAFVVFVLLAQFNVFSVFGKKDTEVNVELTDIQIEEVKPPDIAPPPPPPPPPPPVRPTIKFVEMIAKKDEEVPEEQEITKQEEIQETQVSNVTQEGDKNAKVIIEEVVSTGTGPEPEAPKEPEIFDRAEVNPAFPGGPTELLKFLQKNIKYPNLARENGLEGKVIVKFYVDTDGTVRDPQVLKDGVGGGCAEEAIRVCKSMPKWTPGSQRGKNVKVYYTLPVTFKLQ